MKLNSFSHYFRIIRQVYFKQNIDTFLSYRKAFYWGVTLAKGGTFVGIPKFRRPPGSTIKIGKNIRMLSSFSSNLHGLNRKCMISSLTRSGEISIGNDVGLSGVIIACASKIKIGDRVMIGANTTISDTDSHPINYQHRYPSYYGLDNSVLTQFTNTKEIIIEDDVFIGMHSLILKGSHIAKGSVIGAGSIVTGYIPPGVIAAGQPARILKHIEKLI